MIKTKMIIPPENLEDIARKFGFGKYAKKDSTTNKQQTKNTNETILDDGNYFLFPNIKYENGFIDVRLSKNLLGETTKKTQPEWWEFSQQSPGITVPNMRIFYQLMHRCYKLRNENKLVDAVNSCVSGLRKDFGKHFPYTGTLIKYGNGLNSEIKELQPDKSVSTKTSDIPEFELLYDDNWSYLVLAKEQPESSLGTVEQIPEKAKQFLEAILGDNYEEAGAVLQYLSPRKNDKILCKIYVWVPTIKNRNREMAYLLGRDINNGFGIICEVNILNWPAYGVIIDSKKQQSEDTQKVSGWQSEFWE